MAMVPHERSLVKRMESKPFALIGINFDESRETCKKTEQKNQMTWRSFYDGLKNGPIGEQWNIRGLPTIYVLDPQGVIRYKNVFDKEMDQAVDTLVKENESRAAAK
jgi:hypothetical protein